jgi:hypothetical protein
MQACLPRREEECGDGDGMVPFALGSLGTTQTRTNADRAGLSPSSPMHEHQARSNERSVADTDRLIIVDYVLYTDFGVDPLPPTGTNGPRAAPTWTKSSSTTKLFRSAV